MLGQFGGCIGTAACGNYVIEVRYSVLTLWSLPPPRSIGVAACDPKQIGQIPEELYRPGSGGVFTLPSLHGTVVVILPEFTRHVIVCHFDRSWRQLSQRVLRSVQAIPSREASLACTHLTRM